ncbi:MAG: acyl transferase, partial [Leadbetterella sp.]
STFESIYGPLTQYHFFALLPSYLERGSSSLVHMMQNFLDNSYSEYGGFFLRNVEEMLEKMEKAVSKGDRKIVLIGVTFALLDLVENKKWSRRIKDLAPNIIVMETGGMKGRRKEMIREELHAVLADGLGLESVHSEYGMTELLSQAYSQGDGIFSLPKTMKILLREINDPYVYLPHFALGTKDNRPKGNQKTGGINIIDLLNIDSCAFIETQDLGVYTDDYLRIKIMGRFDNSDIRGCNLLVS